MFRTSTLQERTRFQILISQLGQPNSTETFLSVLVKILSLKINHLAQAKATILIHWQKPN